MSSPRSSAFPVGHPRHSEYSLKPSGGHSSPSHEGRTSSSQFHYQPYGSSEMVDRSTSIPPIGYGEGGVASYARSDCSVSVYGPPGEGEKDSWEGEGVFYRRRGVVIAALTAVIVALALGLGLGLGLGFGKRQTLVQQDSVAVDGVLGTAATIATTAALVLSTTFLSMQPVVPSPSIAPVNPIVVATDSTIPSTPTPPSPDPIATPTPTLVASPYPQASLTLAPYVPSTTSPLQWSAPLYVPTDPSITPSSDPVVPPSAIDSPTVMTDIPPSFVPTDPPQVSTDSNGGTYDFTTRPIVNPGGITIGTLTGYVTQIQ